MSPQHRESDREMQVLQPANDGSFPPQHALVLSIRKDAAADFRRVLVLYALSPVLGKFAILSFSLLEQLVCEDTRCRSASLHHILHNDVVQIPTTSTTTAESCYE